MEAIYKPDGTIKKIYDETQHRHEGLPTVRLTEEQVQNISLCRVNPQTKEAYLIPTCDRKYVKIVDNVLTEMTQEEKAALDAEEAKQQAEYEAQAPERLMQRIINEAQRIMDSAAQERIYDNIGSLCSYRDSSDPILRAEGDAGYKYRDDMWVTCRKIRDDVIAGLRPMPTYEEAIQELPEFKWPE